MPTEYPPTIPEVLHHFARALETTVKNNIVFIPPKYGAGYCLGFKFDKHIRMMILNYTLKQDIVLKSPDGDISGKMLLFKLQHIFPGDALQKRRPIPSVLIATRKIEQEILMPVHTHTATINIEIDADYLSQILGNDSNSSLIKSLLNNDQPYLFEEAVYPKILEVVGEVLKFPEGNTFRSFFLRIKAEELVCRLLMALEARQENQLHALNKADIQAIYLARERILENLSAPPSLLQLASYTNMSGSKLKNLFKQIFGKPIYQYYCAHRMQEAARLLSEEKLSVSAAGYKLGFSNLSHFSRLFEQHIGVKPKKYAMQQ